jgi:predicted lipoprotein
MRLSRLNLKALRPVGTSALVLAALTFLPACKSEVKPPVGDEKTEVARKVLLDAAGACVLRTARDFQGVAGELEAATAALAAGPDAGKQEAARAAFHRAMDVWQVAEVMQVGPAARRAFAGGADIRDNLYSWPLVSRCAVEEQLVSKGYESPDFGSTLVNRRGLFPLEYLLFYEGADTACASNSPIVSGGTWAALSAEERAARKRAYAAVLAADVHRRATQLVQAWSPEQGGFVRTLAMAGPDNTVYPTTQKGLNALSDALFYVESEVKDRKLAPPLGLRDCESDTCPELVESLFAGRSKANLRANLVGFRRLVEGCGTDYAGTGFDDVMVAAGAEPLAVTLRERVVAAQAAVEAVEEADLRQALVQDKASVRAVYDAVKGVTDLLKTEMASVLDLELPQDLEGDND